MDIRECMKSRGFKVLAPLAVIVAVVAITLGATGVLQTRRAEADSDGDDASQADGGGKKQVPVVLTPARAMTFETRFVVSGSVHAERYALVSARIPGTLDEILVDEGDRVQAGTTKLFQTDALKLTKAVAIATQDLAVAQASVQEKHALLAKDVASRCQALNDVKRYRELLKRNAVAAQVAERQETELQQCDADVRHTQALIELAAARLEQARLNLTIAEKDLGDSLVVAPIGGRVSERLREPGEMAAAGTPVLRIEDLSVLEVSVFLPEQAYTSVQPGKTKMRIRVGSVDLGERPVSYKSPTMHHKMRTFEVKGLVASPPEGVVPGCLAEVAIVADSRPGVGVPAGAMQTRGNRSVLFTVEGDRAKMVPVKTGREMDGWLEILEGLAAGMPVVSMGQTPGRQRNARLGGRGG